MGPENVFKRQQEDQNVNGEAVPADSSAGMFDVQSKNVPHQD